MLYDFPLFAIHVFDDVILSGRSDIVYHKLEIIWLLYFVYDADRNYGTGVFIRHIVQENI